MKTNEQVLYAKGAHGVKVYKIWSESNTIHILANGALYKEEVSEGKAGRSLETQIMLRINSRVQNKLDNGFVYDRDNIPEQPTNQLGFVMPMLAQRYDNVKNFFDETVFIQPKLDGHRCLVNDETAYTRRGKEINTLGSLMHRLNLPKGVTLDGELYLHGTPLQTIASWSKRYQKNTEKLQYHVYDLIIEDDLTMSCKDRLKLLNHIVKTSERIKVVPTSLINIEDVKPMFDQHRKQGYEGSIIRTLEGKYSIGKRPKDLLKVKHYFDDEFQCFGAQKSRFGWAIFWFKAKNGKEFKATAPGPVAEKIKAWEISNTFIGKWCTIEYACLTKDGKPFQPVATRWRNPT